MKVKLVDPPKPDFEPLTLTITIESLGELAALWARQQVDLCDVRGRFMENSGTHLPAGLLPGTYFHTFVAQQLGCGHFEEDTRELLVALNARLRTEYEDRTGYAAPE